MSDYIKREDAVNAVADMLCFDAQPQTAGTCTRLDFIDDAKVWIDECQSADVVPVRHGRWEAFEDMMLDTCYRCSECGREFYLADCGTPQENEYNYCPNCGAHMMDEENKDAE